jgi:uncharacterized membrane protein YdbT with pleckstrin-like domain
MADEKLMQGEEIVYETNKHWLSPISDSWKALLLIIGAIVLSWLEPETTTGILGFFGRVIELFKLGLFFAGLGWIIYNFVAWRTAEYKVTNLRVLAHDGLLRSRQTDTLLTSVADVRTKVSAVGRGLGYGDITVYSASGEAGADKFQSVRNVEQFKTRILEQKMKADHPEVGVVAAAAAAASSPAAASAPAQPDAMATLEQLGRLRDSGVITPEEFEAKKQELLSRI